MKLDLTRYRQPVSHFGRTFQPEEVAERSGHISHGGARRARVRHPQGQGQVPAGGTTADGAGARVQPMPRAVPVRRWTRIRPTISAGVGCIGRSRSARSQDEDLETSYYATIRSTSSELMREQFYLALPMKPLCRECRRCKASARKTWAPSISTSSRTGSTPRAATATRGAVPRRRCGTSPTRCSS